MSQKSRISGVTAVISDGQSSRAWNSTRVNRSLADGSEPAEIVDISNLDVRQLRTLLEEHELSSRDALDKALLKKQSAERYYELTRTREAEAQSYLRRYEDAEVVVQELRKAIVDRSKLVLEGQFVTSPTPAREKRQHSPSPGSNVSRKRVAAAAPDRSSEIAVKIEAPSTQPAQDLVVYDAEGESLDDTDGGNDDEEEEEDDDDDDDDDDEGEDEEQVSNRNSLHHEPNSYQLLAEQRLNPYPANVESTGNSRAPATGFCLRDRAGCITLPLPDALPREVFAHDRVCHPWRQHNEPARLRRIVRYDDPSAILVYANALWCAGSQRKKSRAGCAILTRAAQDEFRLAECKGFILEQTGPKDRVLQGDNFLYTQKRADLRAVIAALENQPWASEGWKTVTIATKSAYAYNGMTRSIAKWKSQNWLTGAHPRCPPVTDADLWSHAIGLVNEQAYRGCEVQFWLVPRNQNLQTEDHARWLAKESDLPVPEAYVPFGNMDLTHVFGSATTEAAGSIGY